MAKKPFFPILALVVSTCGVCSAQTTNAFAGNGSSPRPLPELRPVSEHSIWNNDEIADGFRSGAHHAGFTLGAGWGFKRFSENQIRDLALGRLQYGRIISGVVGGDHW